MLLKKIDRGDQFLKQNINLFRCPNCHQPMNQIRDYQVSCENNHQYDLSKKGTLHFLNHTIKTDYDQGMLTHRQKMIDTGLYDQLITRLSELLATDDIETLVDMGCGEGSFLKDLTALEVKGQKIGFDISKDGVNLATEQPIEAFWCVADMTNLPFNDQSISHLLNIFSPSHYEEFRRVLKSQGKIIKVVPEADYLKELRVLFYENNEAKQSYSNEKVVTKFAEELTLVSQERLTYQFPVPKENQIDLLKMSPLSWGATAEAFAKAQENNVETITIDVLILIGR